MIMVDAAAAAAASAAWLAQNHPDWGQQSTSAAQAAQINAAYLANQLPVLPQYATGGGARYTAAEIADAQAEAAKYAYFNAPIDYAKYANVPLSQMPSNVASRVQDYYAAHPSAAAQAITSQYAAQQNRVVSTGTEAGTSVYQAGVGWTQLGTEEAKGTAAREIAREVGRTGGAVDVGLGLKAIAEGAKPSEVYFATGAYITRPSFQSEVLTTKEGQHFVNKAWEGAPIRLNVSGAEIATGAYTGPIETGIHTARGDWGGLYTTGATKAAESNIPTTIRGEKTVAAFADYGLTVVNNKDQLKNALVTYVPYGSYTQEELQNTKLTISKETGEVAIYQYNPERQQWGLIGGGGRNALQSGMFSVGKSLTAFVTEQGAAGTYVTPEGAGLSRLGAESTGGAVRPLSEVSLLAPNEAVSRYFGAYGKYNLANFADQVAGGKAEAPGAKIRYTLAEGSTAPSIQYMGPEGVIKGETVTGVTGQTINQILGTDRLVGSKMVGGASVTAPAELPTPYRSEITPPPVAEYKAQSPVTTLLESLSMGRLPTAGELVSPSSPVRMIIGGYQPSTAEPITTTQAYAPERGLSGLLKTAAIIPLSSTIENVGISGSPVIERIALKPVIETVPEIRSTVTGFGQEVPGAVTKAYTGLREMFGQGVPGAAALSLETKAVPKMVTATSEIYGQAAPGAISASSSKMLGAESGTLEGLASLAAIPAVVGATAVGYAAYIRGGSTEPTEKSAIQIYLESPEGSYRFQRGGGMTAGLTADIFSFIPGINTGLEIRTPSKIAPTVEVTTSPPVVTSVISGGNQTITDIGKWIDINRENVDLYNKTQVNQFNAVVGTYNLMQQQNPVVNTTTTSATVKTTTITPGETIYKYGEWSKFVEGSGQFVSGLLNINPEDVKTAQIGAMAIPEQAGGGTTRFGLGILEYATTQPAEAIVPFTQGLMLAGALEVGGAYVAASAEGTGVLSGAAKTLTTPGTAGIPGSIARAAYNYGLPAGFIGIGAYQVTEGGTATKEQTELNIGRSFIPSAAFVAGGFGISAKVQEVKAAAAKTDYFDLVRVASGGLFKKGSVGIDITEISTGGLFSTTPKGNIQSNLPGEVPAVYNVAKGVWQESGASAFGGVKAAQPGETISGFPDYPDFTSIASGGLLKGKIPTEKIAAEPFGFDVGYTASDAFTRMFGKTEMIAAKVEPPAAKSVEIAPMEITPKYDFSGIGGETRTLVKPEVQPEYSMPTIMFTQVKPSVKTTISYAESLRSDIFAYTKPFSTIREGVIPKTIARPDLLSISLPTPTTEARSVSESSARSMTMFGSLAGPKSIDMSSILGISSFMTSVIGQSKSTATEIAKVKTFTDVINMPIDTIIGRTEATAKTGTESGSRSETGVGSRFFETPKSEITGLPWVDLRSSGSGGGGGGSGGGFKFTDVLQVKTAREVLFGKSIPKRRKPFKLI